MKARKEIQNSCRQPSAGLAVIVATVACLGVAPRTNAAEVELPDVVVKDKSGASVNAASQDTVTREEIEQRPLSRTAEVLEIVPGMIVTQHSGEGKANQYFLRGYNLDHGTDFATWVAGMPVNMPTHAHGQGYMDLNFLIPELISQVRYNKGPYSAEDGDFSSVGSARIGYAERLPSTLATLTAGSFNYRRALLAGSPAMGAGRVVYGLEYVTDDGPWDNPNRFKKLNGMLRYARGDESNGFNVTAMAYSADWNSTDQIPQRAVDRGLIGRFGALDPTDGGKSSRYSMSGEWRQAAGNTTREANVYAIRSRLNLFSNFTFLLNDPVNGDQFEQAEERTVFGGTASQTWSSTWNGARVSNTLGVQLRRDRLTPVALYATAKRTRLTTTRDDAVTVESGAPYVANTIQWNSWLRTIAGLRADFQRYKVSSDIPANSGSASDSIVSPKVTLVLGPWAKTEYYLNWGRGFHSNDARGTTITVDPIAGTPAERVNPLVRTTGYEAGIRTQRIANLTMSLALWQLRQESELLFVGDAGTTEPSRPSLRTGIEWLALYGPTSWLTLDASAGFTRARFSDVEPPGNYIPGAPKSVAAAGMTIGGLGPWSGALRWRYFGSRPLIEDNSVSSSSTSLVNARVGYAISKTCKLQLDAFNLFNRKDSDIDYFYASRLAGEPAGGVADIHFHPVESRSVRLNFIVRL